MPTRENFWEYDSNADDDTGLLIRGVCLWQDSCQGECGRSASGEAPSNILRYTQVLLGYIQAFKHSKVIIFL